MSLYDKDMSHLINEERKTGKRVGCIIIAVLLNQNKAIELARITIDDKEKDLEMNRFDS